MGPVLLLDVGVVVLLVGAAACELDLAGLAVPVEVGVDELRAVIGVDAFEREGERETHLLERRLHAGLALAHDGAGQLGD